MSTHSLHSRPPWRVALAAAASLAGTAAVAASPAPLVMVADADAPGGAALAAGDYAAATQRLRAARERPAASGAALATNRCIAYTLTHELAAARLACDDALSAARLERARLPAWGAPSDARSLAARAYSNRAVLRWLSSDVVGARQDLASARALLPDDPLVAGNIAALSGRTLAATAAVREPSGE